MAFCRMADIWWLTALGGIGLFLFGMLTLTEGLRAMAGPGLQRLLAAAARTPWRGAMVGAGGTAVVQSSSATTVMAVGLVSAGLLTFPQALGIVLGSAVGTTATGWVVALFGFKLKLGLLAQLLVLAGALLALLGSGVWRRIGMALAGFAVIFLGLSLMQEGMAGVQDAVDFSRVPADRWWGMAALAGIGVGMAALVQSSSTTVAAALTAVAAGILDPRQACVVAIGAQIGTTSTGLLAGLAAPTDGRRTAVAHLVHAVIASALALALLHPFFLLLDRVLPAAPDSEPVLVVVAFHTIYNVLSVVLILPWIKGFGRLVAWLVPERRRARLFDPKLAEVPEAALLAIRTRLGAHAADLADVLGRGLEGGTGNGRAEALLQTPDLLGQARSLLALLRPGDIREGPARAVGEAWRACDRVQRLSDRLKDAGRMSELATLPELHDAARRLAAAAHNCARRWREAPASEDREMIAALQALETEGDTRRDQWIAEISTGRRQIERLQQALDALRWMRRAAGHLAAVEHSLYLLADGGSRPEKSDR